MNKFAHLVKMAEVRGVMAYLVDSEMVKVASEEDFDALVNAVSESVEGDYDLNTVLSKTAELLEGEGEEKTASDEENQEDVENYIGKLTLAKMAGDISDEEYNSEMEKIAGSTSIKAGMKARALKDRVVAPVKKYVTDPIHGRIVAPAQARREGLKQQKELRRGIKDQAETYGKARPETQAYLDNVVAATPGRIRAYAPGLAAAGTVGAAGTAGVVGAKKLRNRE